jgi:acylphosphatase
MQQRGHFICHGRVQGVFFRAEAQKEAEHLGLTGWVRNCADGTVEIMVEGKLENVADFRLWCDRGSPYASVTSVDESYTAATGEFAGFQIHL